MVVLFAAADGGKLGGAETSNKEMR